MASSTTLRAAEALSTIRSRVQRETGDTDGDRWDNTAVNAAVNDMLVEMANEMALRHSGEALRYTTLAYGSGSDPVDLPSAVGPNEIVRVDDLTSASNPRQIDYKSPLEMHDYNPSEVQGVIARSYWTLFGPTTSADLYRIKVSPQPTNSMSLRIMYLAPPFTLAADADTSPMSPRWLELIGIGAAMKLLRRDGEGTTQQETDLARLWQQFSSWSSRRKNPRRIRRRRRGI